MALRSGRGRQRDVAARRQHDVVALALALHVSLDDLVFAEGEREPFDDLRLRFEAISHMPEAEKSVIKALLDGMALKHQVSRIMGNSSNNQASS
ncbi:hypothetical protein D3C71_1950490 [compost metagenome]